MRTPARATSNARLAFGLLAAPAAYGLALLFNHVLAPVACRINLLQTGVGSITLLSVVNFAVTIACLALALAGGWVAYQNNQRGREAGAEAGDRSRFLGVGGIMLSVLFIGLTLVAGLSGLAFNPCRPN